MVIYWNTGNLTSDYTTEKRKKKHNCLLPIITEEKRTLPPRPDQQLLTVNSSPCFHDGVLNVDRLHVIQNLGG